MNAPISFADLVPRYDAFILDLWGVIHDGEALYPGVKDALARLKDEGRQVVFLSNAPRRAAVVETVLEGLGIGRDLYRDINTSGETAWHWMKAQGRSWGSRVFYIGLEKDEHLLDGLPFSRAESAGEADFVLNAGFDHFDQPLDEVLPRLQAAREKKLPMLCVNPDLLVVKLDGRRIECAGLIAQEYERMGGAVTYIGKPYPSVYERTMELLGNPPKSRVLAVGDALETDIAGAKAFGLDAALVTGGIHKSAVMNGEHIDTGKLGALCEAHGCAPDYVLAALG